MRRRTMVFSALGLFAAALLPAASQAAITVGSDLSPAATATANPCVLSTPPCTHLLSDVQTGTPYPASSPTDGVVVSFTIKTGGAETVTFRLGRSAAPGNVAARGAGTGPTVTVPGAGTHSYPAGIPVKAGDTVGIDTSSTRAIAAAPCATGIRFYTYHPVLSDGGPFQTPDANNVCELLVNAVIQPSNAFTFGRVTRTRKGAAFLAVTVPGPGQISLSGRGVTRVAAGSPGAAVSKNVGRAGGVRLTIRPNGKTREKLNATGKAKVKVSVTFAPVGGDPRTKRRKVKLTKQLGQ